MTRSISSKLCRSVGDASELLKLIANPNRLSIVCYLMEQECSVTSLEEDLGIRQPTLSQQLTELREAGMIKGRREGKTVVYRVADPKISRIVETLRDLFSGLDDVTSKHAMQSFHGIPVDEMMFD
ncbi:ArsR/SmtB family transcription factor [Phyllobacterium sophorae]|uniref:ArsR family transcriptional regulator n=1 Tax=Phyllobacterium sophorae TaxID=1520277 RepID=A0A2P7BFF6_9HYPH|nr:metalloregulator ArsR/SmtB family transcription factor [Phyllobacterium sophorae]PSH65226.1 ArsR family transcriptional regulator [Phyllobacterium sophorae]